MTLIPLYGYAASQRLVPYESNVRSARDNLILLSNRLGSNRGQVFVANGFLMQEIREGLGLHVRHQSKITRDQFTKALNKEEVGPWPHEGKDSH